jgi:hypothetical protein
MPTRLNFLLPAFLIPFFLASTFSKAHAQTLGGNTAYTFLKFPFASGLTAAGGVNISQSTNDVSVALNNPALLHASLHAQAGLNFTQLPGGVKAYHLAGAHHNQKWNTTFGAQFFFIDYGEIEVTDAAGNSAGHFRATDYVVQLSAGRQYLQKWHYGASFKFIRSSYPPYHSSAVALDVGVQYLDSAKGISVGVVAKNMGAQITPYAAVPEELPFDLQLGITKKLSKAPLAFSASVQQAHRFNLFYHDTTFNQETGVNTPATFSNELFQHFVFAAHVLVAKQLEATVGYNRLRRTDLSIGTTGNGLAGFSTGVIIRFEKLHVSFARSSYQRGVAFNQLGLNLMCDKLFGVGAF